MYMYFLTKLYALKPFLIDYLPVESNVKTNFVEFKITPDKTAYLSKYARLYTFTRVKRNEIIHLVPVIRNF